MNLSRDSMLALQRHFLGALSAPARTWLEPLPGSPLAFTGDAIRLARDGRVLDLGSVASPGEERRLVRVCNRGTKSVEIRLTDRPSWLNARWLDSEGDAVSLPGGTAGAALEVSVTHDAEREFHGVLRFQAAEYAEELRVHMTARRTHPSGRFDFNGAPAPRPFDFGDEERAYELSVENATSVPLVVTLADLPGFLTCEVDGRWRHGPIEGPFFERTAPVTISFRPYLFGSHDGSLRIRTNDPRPDVQDIELRFTSSVVAARPYVSAVPPRRMRMRSDQTFTAAVRLENWSRLPARISADAVAPSLHVREWPMVPAARSGQPGTATLPIRIVPSGLPPGAHTLRLTARVEGGDPPMAHIPVEIDVLPRRNPVLRSETLIVLVAVIALSLLLALMRGLG